MSWINPETILSGELVELIPLNENHFDELKSIAHDKRIWEFFPVDMSTDSKIKNVLSKAVNERKNGNHFPYVIHHKKENKLIGSTRLMDVVPAHKKLEIGWTWLHPDYWATAINLECKLMLLTYCFEELMTIRVQLKTDENNIRSWKAIEKIGARHEGVFRNDMIRENGTIRSSAYFSIIDSEWESVKLNLQTIFKTKMQENEI